MKLESKKMWWCCLSFSPAEFVNFSLLYMPLVNALPGTIDRLRKLSVPVSCWTYLMVTLRLWMPKFKRLTAFITFSLGIETIFVRPLRRVPRKTIIGDDHSVFSSDIRQPTCSQTSRKACYILLQTIRHRAMNKKSSK